MKRIAIWVSAFRLRTLALSFALIIVGSSLAVAHGVFDMRIFGLALLTTLFLQILSNLSNDYGDTVHGADLAGRVGPDRAVQSGEISASDMCKAMVLFGLLSLMSGIVLLAQSLGNLGRDGLLLMFGIGLTCILAAITYTVGRRPYGYMGFGDLSVFLFFGLVGVAGSYALYAGQIDASTLMPATAVGMLSVGVLNMNNLRDHDSDLRAGKLTLVVRYGKTWAKRYQTVLIVGAFVVLSVYVASYGRGGQWLFWLAAPIFAKHLYAVLTTNDPKVIDGQLKMVSVGTLILSVLFAIGTLFF
mgnify:CR=1 FL=1